MSQYLEVCREAALIGGRVLTDWVGKFKAWEKGHADMVTEADLASQEAIRKLVLGKFPDHGFVGEEEAEIAPEAEFCWIVDPLDGTGNYARGIPHYAVSVALAQGEQLVAGTIYDPVRGECFTAERGEGARLNDAVIRTSEIDEIDEAIVACSFPPTVEADSAALAEFNHLIIRCQGMRRSGSAALNLAYLASGRIDGYWAWDLKSWDAAAGALLIQEAGGVLTASGGNPFNVFNPKLVAAGTGSLHRKLLSEIAQVARL